MKIKKQVSSYLTKLRLEKFGCVIISLGELQGLCISNSDVPSDEDEAFVVDYVVVYGDGVDDDDYDDDEDNENRFR
jgi:hypothetical protein